MEIRTFLIETGNLPNLKGYSCLIRAVEIVKNSDKDLKLMRDIYPIIAKEKNTSVSKIERAVRHIVNDRIDDEDYKKIGLTKRPTPSELIYYFADGGRHE